MSNRKDRENLEFEEETRETRVRIKSIIKEESIRLEGTVYIQGRVSRLFQEEMNLKEKSIHDALVHLGWTPPDPNTERELDVAIHCDPVLYGMIRLFVGNPDIALTAHEVQERDIQARTMARFYLAEKARGSDFPDYISRQLEKREPMLRPVKPI